MPVIPLLELFDSISILNETEQDALSKSMRTTFCKKNAWLLTAGQVSSSYFYILQGIIRVFYYQYQDQDSSKEQDQEETTWIACEGNFVYAAESVLTNQPSQCQLQALEACKIVSISKLELDKLGIQFPRIEHIVRVLAERDLLYHYNMQRLLRSNQPAVRLKQFLFYHPELANRISLNIIASFLNIHRTTLSRLRGKLTPSSKFIYK